MPDFLEYLESALAGPMMSQEDFHMNILIPNVSRIVAGFDISYDPEDPVPADDGLADRLYQGAIEFLACTGLYCADTNRVIRMEQKEIEKGLKDYQKAGTFGEGQDRSTMTPRRPEDPTPPFCHIGTGIVAASEEIALSQVEGYARIPQANSISIPAIASVRGVPVTSGSPLELYAVFSAIGTARKALRRAGRPGLPILNLCSSATTAASTIAGSHPEVGLRPSDGWLIDFISEMTVDFNNLNKLAFVKYMGGNIGSTDLTVLGGYAGGPSGTALVSTAYHIAGCAFMKGAYQLTGNINMNLGCSSTRASLWVSALVGRATSRNDRYCAIALPYAVSGPGTKTYFYEAAAQQLAAVVSGYAATQTSHPAKAVINNGVTPTEAGFNAKVAHGIATSGITAGKASELCNRLLEKYEKIIKAQLPGIEGRTYPELYDVKTGKRLEEYNRIYEEVLGELSLMGVPIE